MSLNTKYIAGDAVYRYPEAGDPLPEPLSAKCLLLTIGGVCAIGSWGAGNVAWAPLPKRNHEKEKRLHALKNPTR